MVERIGRYEVQAELGRGGFGRVYRAFDPTVSRLVAIKTLHAGGDPELLTRFRNEAAAAGKLRHRNIIVIHDYGEQGGEPYIVMELLDGEDLHHIVKNRRPLSVLQKMQIMAQVAEGLDHAHRNNVVHRDVKPANIMLLPDFSVKIMDFGIALVTQVAESRLTKSGTVPGTLKYMAPEQFRGSADSASSDIFAFGVTFYEFLSGEHPFEGPSQHAVMFNIVQGEPKPLRELCPECPQALEQLVLTCLNKAPEMRYSSLRDLQLDMKPLMIELQQEHAKSLLAEAERLVDMGRAEGAQALLFEALEIDPGSRAARALREKVQRILRAQMVGPKVNALLDTGRHQLDSQRPDDAISTLEAALKLDASNEDVRTLLTHARNVRKLSATGDVSQSSNQIRRDQYEGEKAEAIRRVRNALKIESFDEALSMIAQLRTAYPDAAETAQLSEEAHAGKEKHNRKVRAATTLRECRALVERREYSTAIQNLEQWVAESPDDSEGLQLLAYAREQMAGQKRMEIVSRLLREVNKLAGEHNFERAIQMLEIGLGYYPGERMIEERLSAVRAAKAEHIRNESLDNPQRLSAAMGGSARDSQNPREKTRPLDGMTAITGRIERLIEQSQSAAAIAAAEDALVQHPGHPALQALLVRAQEQRRLRQRTEAVARVLSQVDELLAAHKFGPAIKLIEDGLQSFPGDAKLNRARESALAARASFERKQVVGKAVAEARALLNSEQPEQVILLCQPVLDRYPDESAVATLMSQAKDYLHQRELRKRECQRIERDAKAQIASGNPDAALQLIEEGRRQFPDAASLLELFEQARRMKLSSR